jgi:hypothetical protein
LKTSIDKINKDKNLGKNKFITIGDIEENLNAHFQPTKSTSNLFSEDIGRSEDGLTAKLDQISIGNSESY